MSGDVIDDTFVRISTVVRRTFALDDGVPIRAGTSSADVDAWDSLSYSMLIMGVEEEFGIELPLERVFALNDVGELVTLVRAVRGTEAQ